MYLMQYEITLPADYDMAIIRRRVATRGMLTDGFPGLGLKAYCIRERGSCGSPVNEYAPFYVWGSLAGMTAFLLGDGFRGLADDFGRPPVRRWTGIAYAQGPAVGRAPRSATRRTLPLPAGQNLAAAVEKAQDALHQRADSPGVHSAALALDAHSWELVEFTLCDTPGVGQGEGVRYEVLHLSSPDLNQVTMGRPLEVTTGH